jgi:dTDP-4-amino-4,6-dideoxygalactose transaminase
VKIEVYSPTIRRKEMDAVLTALVEDKVGPGEQSRLLCTIAKEHIGFEYCCTMRSPAIALFFALKMLNLEYGQGVLISALSPQYYSRVITDLNLVPVYCDVGAVSACINRETVEATISAQTEHPPRCLIVHHTLGFVPDMASLMQLGLPVIEDCSCSYGTVKVEPEGQKPVSATFTLLGLEERDMLTAGGGAILFATSRREASILRTLGDLPPEYGLPDMNAAMAVVQFREAAKNLGKRGEIAAVYTQSALRTRHKRFIQNDTTEYNNYAFPLVLETGVKEVRAYTKHYDIEIESAFAGTAIGAELVKAEQCPEAYSLALRTMLFPLYPRLGAPAIEKVAKLIGTLP